MLSNGFWSQMRRYPRHGFIAGVCAGIAAYFDWNPRLIRVLAVLLLIFGAFVPMLLVYCVLWYLMDVDPGRPGLRGDAGDSAPASSYAPQVSPDDLRRRFARMEDRLRNMEACVAAGEFELRRELRKLE